MHRLTPQRLASTLAAVLAVIAVTCASVGTAAASTPPAPTGGCASPLDPTCTVAVTGGSQTGGNDDGGQHHGTGGGGGNGVVTPGCHNTNPNAGCDPCPDNNTRAQDPAACNAFSHNLTCSELNPQGLAAAGWQTVLRQMGCVQNHFTPVSPAVVAQQAFATIRFPHPSGHRSPSEHLSNQGYPFAYLNSWVYYYTDRSTWHALTATATVGGVSATVTARPVALTFDPGDGSKAVSCAGPGEPWVAADGLGVPPAGACGFRYRQVTAGPITSTQSIIWKITWVGTGHSSGEIPSTSTSTSGRLQVLQIQSVVVPR